MLALSVLTSMKDFITTMITTFLNDILNDMIKAFNHWVLKTFWRDTQDSRTYEHESGVHWYRPVRGFAG